MKINQMIQAKRKELSLTQGQIADYLGVTASAVNKWEKGSTYPDITLLPALARLLKTDLNTLMSFNNDLTDMEVINFVDEVDKIVREQSYETAFQAAIEKIQEYPNCEKLIYSVILYLDGALFLYNISEPHQYKEIFEKFYERMSASENPQIKETAISMLISYNRNRGDFAKAEEIINTLQTSSIDKEQQLAILYTQQGKYESAEKIWEYLVLNGVTEIQNALINMLEIAIYENRKEDAVFFADMYEAVSKQFSVPNWISHVAHLQLAVIKKDKDACLSILKNMLPAMRDNWYPEDCPLYRNMTGKDTTVFSGLLADTIRADLIHNEEFSFIRGEEEFDRLIAEVSNQTG